MKYLFILLLAVFVSNNTNGQVVIRYTDTLKKSLTFTHGYREIGDETSILNVINNTVWLKSSLPETILCNDIQHQNLIYIEPGDTILIKLDKNGLLEYNAPNNIMRKNESLLINAIYQKHGPILPKVSKNVWLRSTKQHESPAFHLDHFNNEQAMLDSAYATGTISRGFKDYFSLIFYSLNWINKLQKITSTERNTALKTLQTELDKMPDDAINIPEFRRLLWLYTFQNIEKQTTQDLTQKLNYINTLFTQPAFTDYLLYRQITALINNKENIAGDIQTLFNRLCNNDRYKELIYEEINKNNRVLNDKTFQTLIKPYSGKVIFIDFWASWCAPCLEEMPYYPDLIRQFPEIEFLFLSIDESVTAWNNSKLRLTHIMNSQNSFLLPAGKKSDLAKIINLSTIPRYCLFDAKGNLIDSNAPSPSNPKLIHLLQKTQQKALK